MDDLRALVHLDQGLLFIRQLFPDSTAFLDKGRDVLAGEYFQVQAFLGRAFVLVLVLTYMPYQFTGLDRVRLGQDMNAIQHTGLGFLCVECVEENVA